MASVEPEPRINPPNHLNSYDWCGWPHRLVEQALQSWAVALRLALLVLVFTVAAAAEIAGQLLLAAMGHRRRR